MRWGLDHRKRDAKNAHAADDNAGNGRCTANNKISGRWTD
jgi:hypothetical protein